MAWVGLLGALATAAVRAEPPTTAPADHPAERETALSPAAIDPWSSPEIVAPPMDARPLPRGRQMGGQASGLSRDRPEVGPPNMRTGSWLRTTASLAGVVSLIALLAWGYRSMAARGGFCGTTLQNWHRALRGKNNGLIEMIGRLPLAPRQSLCLVRIGPRLVLLGVSPDAVRALDVIGDPELAAQLVGQAARLRGDSQTAEFARCLEGEAGRYEPAAQEPPEPATPEPERIIGLRQRLAGTIERLRATARGASEKASGTFCAEHPEGRCAAKGS